MSLDLRIHSVTAFLSVLINFTLVVILWGTMRVTPQELQATIQDMEIRRSQEITAVADLLQVIGIELDKRGEWIESTDTELAHRAGDRINREQVRNWLEEARRLNPELIIPDIRNLPKTSSVRSIDESPADTEIAN